ncbi:hypothetical protein T05_14731 [Trichinella murrelli]|uniref:Uncharacterized protein n=1 Tax=Trichinella murrelli TaxID=144512 RepID=A0A0V0UGH6_9BILA|nr:hypothetical protein T05_14731 [Trichinella murrelli]
MANDVTRTSLKRPNRNIHPVDDHQFVATFRFEN